MENYLIFDNLQFKLSIIQVLMYEQHLFKDDYRKAQEFLWFIEQNRVEDCQKYLLKHIENALKFYQDLKIPSWMANQIYTLHIDIHNEIYHQINPLLQQYHTDEDFAIMNISKRELQQFPHLRQMTFHSLNGCSKKCIRSLEKMGIEVVDYEQEYLHKRKYHGQKQNIYHEKTIHPLITLLCFIGIVTFFTTLTYQQIRTDYQKQIDQEIRISYEEVEKEEIAEGIIKVYNSRMMECWLEDIDGNKLTKSDYFSIEGPYSDDYVILKGQQGDTLFDYKTLTYGNEYLDIQRVSVRSQSQYSFGYLVSHDRENWYLLWDDKLYDKSPVTIHSTAVQNMFGMPRFTMCYADVTDLNHIVIKHYLEVLGKEDE